MLVKSADLPKFNLNIEEKQQYNKKTYINTRIGYEPVNITFHDDHADTVNAFWKAYYEYNFSDSLTVNPNVAGFNTVDNMYDDAPNVRHSGYGIEWLSITLDIYRSIASYR